MAGRQRSESAELLAIETQRTTGEIEEGDGERDARRWAVLSDIELWQKTNDGMIVCQENCWSKAG